MLLRTPYVLSQHRWKEFSNCVTVFNRVLVLGGLHVLVM
jgi:recombinational DNA repair protein (RecF pathway)